VRRATERRSEAAGQSAAPYALALHRSPARQRLLALEKEHERLLNEIKKKKLACETSERAAAEAARALEARLRPLRAAFASALSELRAIFTGLLGEDSHLNRRDRARIRRAYARILPELLAEERDAGEDSEWPGAGPGDPSGEGRPPPEGDAGFSAPRPEKRGTELLRSLFRKLAVALHPDKSQEPAERAALTAVMKEVTRAYEMGDVARLVELERSWLAAPASEPEDDVAQRTLVITRSNQELRRQLRALSAELKELKEVIAAAGGPRRGTPVRGAPPSGKDALLAELEREVSELVSLRDLAQSFLSGEIDLGEFLLGPVLSQERDLDPAEELLSELFGERWGGRDPFRESERAAERGSRARKGAGPGRSRRST
jgi:hypothetical protein